jgi:hypothetical protein
VHQNTTFAVEQVKKVGPNFAQNLTPEGMAQPFEKVVISYIFFIKKKYKSNGQ